MIRLAERGGLEHGIGSRSLHIGRTETQTILKGGLKERDHSTMWGWLRAASELTDALLGHIQGKFTVVVLDWVLMKPTMVRRCNCGE